MALHHAILSCKCALDSGLRRNDGVTQSSPWGEGRGEGLSYSTNCITCAVNTVKGQRRFSNGLHAEQLHPHPRIVPIWDPSVGSISYAPDCAGMINRRRRLQTCATGTKLPRPSTLQSDYPGLAKATKENENGEVSGGIRSLSLVTPFTLRPFVKLRTGRLRSCPVLDTAHRTIQRIGTIRGRTG